MDVEDIAAAHRRFSNSWRDLRDVLRRPTVKPPERVELGPIRDLDNLAAKLSQDSSLDWLRSLLQIAEEEAATTVRRQSYPLNRPEPEAVKGGFEYFEMLSQVRISVEQMRTEIAALTRR
jgi:hypothetical protein